MKGPKPQIPTFSNYRLFLSLSIAVQAWVCVETFWFLVQRLNEGMERTQQPRIQTPGPRYKIGLWIFVAPRHVGAVIANHHPNWGKCRCEDTNARVLTAQSRSPCNSDREGIANQLVFNFLEQSDGRQSLAAEMLNSRHQSLSLRWPGGWAVPSPAGRSRLLARTD